MKWYCCLQLRRYGKQSFLVHRITTFVSTYINCHCKRSKTACRQCHFNYRSSMFVMKRSSLPSQIVLSFSYLSTCLISYSWKYCSLRFRTTATLTSIFQYQGSSPHMKMSNISSLLIAIANKQLTPPTFYDHNMKFKFKYRGCVYVHKWMFRKTKCVCVLPLSSLGCLLSITSILRAYCRPIPFYQQYVNVSLLISNLRISSKRCSWSVNS